MALRANIQRDSKYKMTNKQTPERRPPAPRPRSAHWRRRTLVRHPPAPRRPPLAPAGYPRQRPEDSGDDCAIDLQNRTTVWEDNKRRSAVSGSDRIARDGVWLQDAMG